jgi:hypothetical protein
MLRISSIIGPQWRLDITNSPRLASGRPPTKRIYA